MTQQDLDGRQTDQTGSDFGVAMAQVLLPKSEALGVELLCLAVFPSLWLSDAAAVGRAGLTKMN